MHRKLTRYGYEAVVVALAVCFLSDSAVVQANDWVEGGASKATSGQMDDHKASSKNLDDMTVGSHDPDEMTVESGTMDGRMAESQNPAKMVTGAEKLDGHEGSSTSLGDLEKASPDEDFENIESPGQSEWETTTDPEVLAARKHLLRAQQRAQDARTAYGDMMQRDYPRGAARVQIVNERDASMKALEEAKSALAAY